MLKFLKPFSFIPALLMMYMIFSFSSQDGITSSQLSYKVSYKIVETGGKLLGEELEPWEIDSIATRFHGIVRKIAHMGEYFLLAIAVAFPLYVYGLRGILLMIVAGMFCVAFACGDEYHQSFIEGRSPSRRDVLIDSFGVFWGIVLVRIVGWTGRKTIFRPFGKKKKQQAPYSEPQYTYGNPPAGNGQFYGAMPAGGPQPYAGAPSGSPQPYPGVSAGSPQPYDNVSPGGPQAYGNAASGGPQPYGNATSGGSQPYGNAVSGGPQVYGNAASGGPQSYGNAASGGPQPYGNAASGRSQSYGNAASGGPQPYRNMTSGGLQPYGNAAPGGPQPYGNAPYGGQPHGIPQPGYQQPPAYGSPQYVTPPVYQGQGNPDDATSDKLSEDMSLKKLVRDLKEQKKDHKREAKKTKTVQPSDELEINEIDLDDHMNI